MGDICLIVKIKAFRPRPLVRKRWKSFGSSVANYQASKNDSSTLIKVKKSIIKYWYKRLINLIADRYYAHVPPIFFAEVYNYCKLKINAVCINRINNYTVPVIE